MAQNERMWFDAANIIIGISAIAVAIGAIIIAHIALTLQSQEYNAANYSPIMSGVGNDIVVENTFLPFTTPQVITVNAITNHVLIFKVLNATYHPSFYDKCFFAKSPTIRLWSPQPTTFQPHQSYVEIRPTLMFNYTINGTFIGAYNNTEKPLSYELGEIEYNLSATDYQDPGKQYTFSAFSSLLANLPHKYIPIIDEVCKNSNQTGRP